MDPLQEQIFPTLRKHSSLFDIELPIWEIMFRLNDLIRELQAKWGAIHEEAFVHKQAIITNSYIGKGVKVYEGCTVRDSVILDGTVVGHGAEIARSLLLADCFIPRFNYVGGSMLGEHVQLGGGVMLAARRHDDRPVTIHWGMELVQTNRWKFGSIIGNDTVIGYGSHVNPGAVIGNNSLIMPMVDVRGYIPPDSLVFVKQKVVVTRRRSFPDLISLDDLT